MQLSRMPRWRSTRPTASRRSMHTVRAASQQSSEPGLGSKAAAAALSLALLLSPVGAEANTVLQGPARVVDGDTLEVQGQKIRLFGLDAPEKAQPCKDPSGATYSCGLLSKQALSDKIAGRPVSCTVKNQDQYGRNVSVCSVPGGLLGGPEELNAWLVSNGYAVAYRQYGKEYIPLEEEAHAARRGVWKGEFQMPNEWRKAQKAGGPAAAASAAVAGQTALPSSVLASLTSAVAGAPVAAPPAAAAGGDRGPPCPGGQLAIKGNIGTKGDKIYHVPGGKLYDKVKIDVADGEKWFCTVAEAEAAGWRASKSG